MCVLWPIRARHVLSLVLHLASHQGLITVVLESELAFTSLQQPVGVWGQSAIR